MTMLSRPDLAKTIDHTILKPEALPAQIDTLCEEARAHRFAAVCVNPLFVRRAAERLKGSGVEVATVVGFPLGATTTATKVFETKDAIQNGATEIDMVLAIGLLKAGDSKAVEEDIRAVVEAARGKTVKVILETCLLTPDEIRTACTLSLRAGAHFVKTSTGFSTGGATIEAVRIMKETVGTKARIKASGGIRTRESALAMIEAGAERIGTSSGVTIVTDVC